MGMQIHNQKTSTNFKAIKVANTRNMAGAVVTNIEIMKLTKEDTSFLEKLANTVSYRKLYPKLNQLLQDRWQNVFNYCISQAKDLSNESYMAFSEGKPCGILTYKKQRNSLYLDGICSIPIAINKKVAYVSKTLFCLFFRKAHEFGVKELSLSAVQNGPFNVVQKYESLGFKKDVTSFPYTKMTCNKYDITKQHNKLMNEIEYEECEPEKIRIDGFLD